MAFLGLKVSPQSYSFPPLHFYLAEYPPMLKGEHGESPPTVNADNINSEICQELASFASSLISSSSTDVNCQDHIAYDEDCQNCDSLKDTVEKYQTHSHKHSCLKKNKIVRIKETEGHGRFDGEKEGEELIVQVCRYNFPKNPIDETEHIMGFTKDHDKKDIKKAKED